jgi:hypothetical protein
MKDFNDFAIGLETVFRTNENAFTYSAIFLLLCSYAKLLLIVVVVVLFANETVSLYSVLDRNG